QHDVFSRVEDALDQYDLIQAPTLIVALALSLALLLILLPIIGFALPRPLLTWLTPSGTDERFFAVHRATELLTSMGNRHDDLQAVPVRLQGPTDGSYIDPTTRSYYATNASVVITPGVALLAAAPGDESSSSES